MTSVRYNRHLTPAQYEAKVEARFWTKVDKTETCWVWTARVTTNGYGALNYTEYNDSLTGEGVTRRYVRAHRYSWERTHGPIPEGIEIDHICHNRLCVRPDHLRPATRKQNSEHRSGPTRISKSGVRGVYWDVSKGKWRARVGHNMRHVNVGLFDDLAEAEAAVISKRNELHTRNDADRRAA